MLGNGILDHKWQGQHQQPHQKTLIPETFGPGRPIGEINEFRIDTRHEGGAPQSIGTEIKSLLCQSHEDPSISIGPELALPHQPLHVHAAEGCSRTDR